ncbi:hypothetical protein KDK_52460 [Dictyobacter kobayashii]|uniref:Uncharacterized protein n=2 Tax=Dictyobacter kobayashii TaxID=2014872 RepID=A0A402AQS2_9CHLR|nr:hypothetical protein KDK_52460 [Dictyobacter kobayashii]
MWGGGRNYLALCQASRGLWIMAWQVNSGCAQQLLLDAPYRLPRHCFVAAYPIHYTIQKQLLSIRGSNGSVQRWLIEEKPMGCALNSEQR